MQPNSPLFLFITLLPTTKQEDKKQNRRGERERERKKKESESEREMLVCEQV
jgi:hypothetical protein